MTKKIKTINDAAHEWVREFNQIPYELLEKLCMYEPDFLSEVTPPAANDRVYVFDENKYGTIAKYDSDSDVYLIEFDSDSLEDELHEYTEDEFEVEYDSTLPMWGWLWQFGDGCDEYWIGHLDGLRALADCGFRVYESDYGYFFGIDGAGYDFYEAHFCPLYKARGLKWHDEVTENGKTA